MIVEPCLKDLSGVNAHMVEHPRPLTLSRCHQPLTKTHPKVGVHRPFDDLKAPRALGTHPRDHLGGDRMRSEPDQRRFTLAGIPPPLSCWPSLRRPGSSPQHISACSVSAWAWIAGYVSSSQRCTSAGRGSSAVRSGVSRGRRSASMGPGSGRSRAVSSGLPDRHSGVALPLRGGLAHRT